MISAAVRVGFRSGNHKRQCLDWLAWHHCTVTGWASKFDLQLMSLWNSTCHCPSKSVAKKTQLMLLGHCVNKKLQPPSYLNSDCLFVGFLTSQQQASVSQGWICSDSFTCCHTEIKVADQTFHLTQSQYTDTGPTSPSADPIMPGAWQGSHWRASLYVTGMTRPRKSALCKQNSNPGSSALEVDALTTRPTRQSNTNWHTTRRWTWYRPTTRQQADPLVAGRWKEQQRKLFTDCKLWLMEKGQQSGHQKKWKGKQSGHQKKWKGKQSGHQKKRKGKQSGHQKKRKGKQSGHQKKWKGKQSGHQKKWKGKQSGQTIRASEEMEGETIRASEETSKNPSRKCHRQKTENSSHGRALNC